MSSKALNCRAGGLNLSTPIILASGTWPYESEYWTEEALEGVGAACGKAISCEMRKGNSGTRIWETPSGVMNSIGLQNPGAKVFLEHLWPKVKDGARPCIFNVTVESLEDMEGTLRVLSVLDSGGQVVELNVSCPNVAQGCMAWGQDPKAVAQVVNKARSLWKGPLWVKLTPQAADLVAVGRSAQEEGADALVACNTWLGAAIDPIKGRPVFDRVVAGLSGPAIFPLALRTVWQLCSELSIDVIGCGGVTTGEDIAAMMMAGASAVQVGVATFSSLSAPKEMCEELILLMEKHHMTSVEQLKNFARRP